MKFIIIPAFLLLSIGKISAQKNSCDLAYRFDAAYTRDLDQLESVSIMLNQSKPLKENPQVIKNVGSFYYVNGAASPKQFLSVEANVGFKKCYIQPNLELYKAEIKNGMRTFTIPAGSNGNHSINIPIQVITPASLPNPNKNGAVLWGPGNFKVKFVNGYLAQGEYILIDKNSLSPDGTQMKGYAFSIR